MQPNNTPELLETLAKVSSAMAHLIKVRRVLNGTKLTLERLPAAEAAAVGAVLDDGVATVNKCLAVLERRWTQIAEQVQLDDAGDLPSP